MVKAVKSSIHSLFEEHVIEFVQGSERGRYTRNEQLFHLQRTQEQRGRMRFQLAVLICIVGIPGKTYRVLCTNVLYFEQSKGQG